jgi:hypothetical protein
MVTSLELAAATRFPAGLKIDHANRHKSHRCEEGQQKGEIHRHLPHNGTHAEPENDPLLRDICQLRSFGANPDYH